MTYENERLERVHEEAAEGSLTAARDVPELPRDPLHVLAGRGPRWSCSATAGSSAAAPIPTASACSATRARRPSHDVWTGATRHRGCARDLNAGGSKFCGDCPLKLPLKKDEAPPQRDRSTPAPLPSPAVHRVHGRLQHLVHPGVLRAGNRHHPHPPGRHARLRSVPPRRRRGRPVARPHRLLQLRRGVPAQARGRDVRVHQGAAFRTSTSTRAPTAWRSPRSRRGGWCTPASTKSRSRSTAPRRRATSTYRQRGNFDKAHRATCAAMADEKRRAGRDVPFLNWRYILFNWNDSDAEMDAGAASWPPRSASIGCAGRSPTTPRTRSRAASCPAPPTSPRSGTRSGTTTTSATPFPARRRGREIDVRDAGARRCR